MKKKPFSCPVYAIPPSYNNSDSLAIENTISYLNYLEKGGANCIMTTAGTSQFNLLTINEVRMFNLNCAKYFNGSVILGLHPATTNKILEEIDWLSSNLSTEESKRAVILLLFPERYYSDDQLLDYFGNIADNSPFPIMIHANSLKKGPGGTFEYTGKICTELAKHSNIVGMKEESSSWDIGYKLCQEVRDADEEFGIIVAGGSQKRYLALETAGANSFLTGIGNIFPEIAENFYANTHINNKSAKELVRKYEEPFFKVFMKIGWHAAMREGLKQKGFLSYNRDPFVEISQASKDEIKRILKSIEINLKRK